MLLPARLFRAANRYAGAIVLGALGFACSTILVTIEEHLLAGRSSGWEC